VCEDLYITHFLTPLWGALLAQRHYLQIPGSVACQVHYPAADESFSAVSSKQPYFRPQAVEGVADYSRTSAELLQLLTNRQHPCLINADPRTDKTRTFPVVVFSHGLGGCMEMYTQLCQQIASHGFLVFALEHEDGSGAYAETNLGDSIFYKRPDDSPYSRQKVLNFRRSFLHQRTKEVSDVVDAVFNRPEATCPELQKILKSADLDKGVALVGHSFGGSTMVMQAQEYQSQSTSNLKLTQINSLSILDPWAFSLEDKVLDAGLSSSMPTLSILSESWLTNPETRQVDHLLRKCEKLDSLYAPRSVHASVADSVSWLPGFVGRKLYLRGKKEGRFQTITTVAKACVQHIKSSLGTEIPDQRKFKGLERYTIQNK